MYNERLRNLYSIITPHIRSLAIQYMYMPPCDICHGRAFLPLFFSLPLCFVLELCKSVAGSAIMDLWPEDVLYNQVRSWLGTIPYELPWGHFGNGVNPRIVIGKFLTSSWDISSGTDGHNCDSANLESPHDSLLWIPISCESIYIFYMRIGFTTYNNANYKIYKIIFVIKRYLGTSKRYAEYLLFNKRIFLSKIIIIELYNYNRVHVVLF